MEIINYILEKYRDNGLDKNIVDKINEAYLFAVDKHKGKMRKNGEEFITHPLNVAKILTDINVDETTIIAALIHETISESDATLESIEEKFGSSVANIVDNLTKINKLKLSDESESGSQYLRKVLVGLSEDVRVLIIKLADRLHNMRTLQFKSIYKQKENAIETMEIFAPLANCIGAYRIKDELEDLSFKYLMPTEYEKTLEDKIKIELDNEEILKEMLFKIQSILSNNNIPNEIKIRTKNIYGIYKRVLEVKDIAKIHDLLALKIMVDEVETCYKLLYLIHSEYKPLNDMKDYICNPKINMYQSLHSTVFGPKGRLVQAQIRTFEMDKTASFGLTAYWDIHKGNARNKMQSELKQKYQFFESLVEIDSIFSNNSDFVEQVKFELLGDKIIVYTRKGERIELPEGSTIVDFAYKISSILGDEMVKVFVNDVEVPFDYILQNHDRVRIITDSKCNNNRDDWKNIAVTSHARRLLKE